MLAKTNTKRTGHSPPERNGTAFPISFHASDSASCIFITKVCNSHHALMAEKQYLGEL